MTSRALLTTWMLSAKRWKRFRQVNRRPVTLFGMNTTELLSSIDSEIARLQEARALLAGQNGHALRTPKPAKKRTMSAEGRARIGAEPKHDGLLARWANKANHDPRN
jgi:hypothetical protein